MARPKEEVRQNKAMRSILRGETPEKRIMVGYESKEEKPTGDKIDRLSDIMKEARMPWFCPACKKVMKKRVDNKMWSMYGHCFDCQVDYEHKLRLEGKYEDWQESKIKENKLAWIKDQKQSILEWMNESSPTIFNQTRPDSQVDKEKWTMDKKAIEEKAKEALEHLEKIEESLS